MEFEILRDLAIALALGLLVGMQREYAEKSVAGIRTFSLITLLGALTGLLVQQTNEHWIISAALLAVTAMFWIGNRNFPTDDEARPGLTTEITGLVMFLVGVLVMINQVPVAVVTAGVVAVLLHWKKPLHAFVQRMGEDDFRAVVRLVLIGMVILPIMPDKTYGPYEVLNPFQIWLMVVLIVGISMAAYVAQRLLGSRVGIIVTGVLGGLISSTATTVSYARRARAGRAQAATSALVIMLASTIVFARVIVEVFIVAPAILASIVPPLAIMMAFMALVAALAFFIDRARPETAAQQHPPSDLSAAVTFGLLYAGVLIAVAAVKQYYGNTGMYVVAAISGLTDMDAITLSSAQLMKSGSLETAVGWRLILVGAMANLLFKAGVIAFLANRILLTRIAIMFALCLAAGAALLLLWPG